MTLKSCVFRNHYSNVNPAMNCVGVENYQEQNCVWDYSGMTQGAAGVGDLFGVDYFTILGRYVRFGIGQPLNVGSFHQVNSTLCKGTIVGMMFDDPYSAASGQELLTDGDIKFIGCYIPPKSAILAVAKYTCGPQSFLPAATSSTQINHIVESFGCDWGGGIQIFNPCTIAIHGGSVHATTLTNAVPIYFELCSQSSDADYGATVTVDGGCQYGSSSSAPLLGAHSGQVVAVTLKMRDSVLTWDGSVWDSASSSLLLAPVGYDPIDDCDGWSTVNEVSISYIITPYDQNIVGTIPLAHTFTLPNPSAANEGKFYSIGNSPQSYSSSGATAETLTVVTAVAATATGASHSGAGTHTFTFSASNVTIATGPPAAGMLIVDTTHSSYITTAAIVVSATLSSGTWTIITNGTVSSSMTADVIEFYPNVPTGTGTAPAASVAGPTFAPGQGTRMHSDGVNYVVA